jgi:glutaminase
MTGPHGRSSVDPPDSGRHLITHHVVVLDALAVTGMTTTSTSGTTSGPGTRFTGGGAAADRVRAQLTELYGRHVGAATDGVVSYYPPEAEARRETFGLSGVHVSGARISLGDCGERFPLHSISKVFTYALALEDNGRTATLSRIGVEPSGDPFNSITFDEAHHRPHNPMVNAGALVTTALVEGKDPEEKLERILAHLRVYAGNDNLEVDWDLFDREMRTADRNRATAYLMRSQGMLTGDVEAILALYLQQCSVKVTCRDLTVMAATLASGCANPITGERVLPRDRVRDVLSVMYTCGMYDAAGEWAYDVGVPAKSGVSGGILAAVPGKGGLAVYSPGLDEHGNSVRGIGVCREVSSRLGLHVFATEEEDAMWEPAD